LIFSNIPLQSTMILIYSCHLATCHFAVHWRRMQLTQQHCRGISCGPPYPLQKKILTSGVNMMRKGPPQPGLPCRPSSLHQVETPMVSHNHLRLNTAPLGGFVNWFWTVKLNSIAVHFCWPRHSCDCINKTLLSACFALQQ